MHCRSPGPHPGVGGVEGSGLGGLQAHTQGGELKGLAWLGGGVSTPTPRGRSPGSHPGRGVEGSGLGGFPRPHPGGGLQAHTWGVS